MDSRFKSVIANSLQRLGLLGFAETLAKSRLRVVFTFHRVLPQAEMDGCYNPYLAITPDSFDFFLSFLAGHCPVLSMSEFMADYETRPGPYCTLTFDDGWEDNHRHAFPILKKHSMPATIFLCTGLIGTTASIPEETLWRIHRSASDSGREAEFLGALQAELPASVNGGSLSYAQAQARLKPLGIARKRSLLAELEQQFGIWDSGRTSLMNWPQVEEMRKAGINFGSHTVHHAVLTAESGATVQSELSEAKTDLEKHAPAGEYFLAYPNGAFNDEVVRSSKAAGYAGAFTTKPGYARRGTQRHAVPRVGIDNAVVSDESNVFSTARTRLHVLRRGSIHSNASAGGTY